MSDASAIGLVSVALSAGAGLYVWVLLSQLHPPVVTPVLDRIRRSWIRPLLECSWCSGFWLSVLFIPFLQWGNWGWFLTPASILASAALIGLLGSFTPGMEVEDDDN